MAFTSDQEKRTSSTIGSSQKPKRQWQIPGISGDRWQVEPTTLQSNRPLLFDDAHEDAARSLNGYVCVRGCDGGAGTPAGVIMCTEFCCLQQPVNNFAR